MCDRIYRGVFGFLILVGLYFEVTALLIGIVAISFFEGLTNLRVPLLFKRVCIPEEGAENSAALGLHFENRFSVEAEQMFRLTVGILLGLGFFILPEPLWFITWFMGFALLGAGASGVCPLYLSLRWIGFR